MQNIPNGAVVGFGRDGAAQQPNVALELRVLDENGKPTTAKPFGGTIDKDVPAQDSPPSRNQPDRHEHTPFSSCPFQGYTRASRNRRAAR